MKVVGISDIHGQLFSKKNIPECDIVCICGDIMPLEIDRNLIASTAWFVGEFIPWCEKLPCKYVLFTPGNHDFLFDESIRSFTLQFFLLLPNNIFIICIGVNIFLQYNSSNKKS